mgnify:CR=1 FL=1
MVRLDLFSLFSTAYAFVEAIVVTPLGALSVVISAILSSIFLDEKLSFFGWLGCGLCIVRRIASVLPLPSSQSPSARLSDHRTQRPSLRISWSDTRVPKALLGPRISCMGLSSYRRLPGHHLLLWTEIRQEKHVVVHLGV